MAKEERIIALGSAYVEGKIHSSVLHLPTSRNELPIFLDNNPDTDLYAGGSIPNILTSFVRLSGNPNVKLLSCVGDDPRGRFYLQHMDKRIGEPQISGRKRTDIWVGIYNNGLVESTDLYGAAANIKVSKEELQAYANKVFITDVDVCRIPAARDCARQALETIEDDGLFVLSLVGMPSNRNIDQILSFTSKVPDLVFGNSSEIIHAANEHNINTAIKSAFPGSRLVVVTQAEKGALIRYEEQIFSVSAVPVSKERVIDETGAGDSYMGTMLALLIPTLKGKWREADLINAAKAASYASSLVIQSMESRLTPSMTKLVIDYTKNLGS